MRQIILIAMILFMAFPSSSEACLSFSQKHSYSSLSNLGINESGISQEESKKLIDKIMRVYKPIFETHFAKLNINLNWDDSFSQGYAWRDQAEWNVQISGGLIRSKKMTPAGLVLVICHEIGHHIGGAPKFDNGWSSVEGQADYYAVSKCFRNLADKDEFFGSLVDTSRAPEIVKELCRSVHLSEYDYKLCLKTAMAGYEVVQHQIQDLHDFPSEGHGPLLKARFDTPDSSVVSSTMSFHPFPQCRLDTYFQASLCAVSNEVDISQKNPLEGTCNKDNGHLIGGRPSCWYKDL